MSSNNNNSNQTAPTIRTRKTQQQPINLLILNLSPRKIKLFEAKLQKLNTKYDILRIKNDFDEKHAYNSGRDWFLKHPEYTHMAILPDDLLLETKHVDKLINDLEQYDYPVLSGICNFAMSTKNFFSRMTAIEHTKYEAVDYLAAEGRFDYFKDVMTRDRWKELREQMKDKPNRIIRVAWSAFPFTIIRRDVVEKIEFGSNLMGVDTVFFQSCINLSIPTYADLDVEMLHIKGIENNHEMQNSIFMAYDKNVCTAVLYTKSNPPKRDEIFLPKTQ